MNHITSNLLTQLIIEPTGLCNANCPHCPRFDENGYVQDHIPLTNLKIDALSYGLDKSLLSNLKLVSIAGATGDPMISPYITNIIEFFDFVPKIVVDTNGSLRNIDWWQELTKYKNLIVEWSIDGLEDTNHLYRVNTSWKKIIENANAYIRSGGRSIWKCLIFKHNEHQIDQIKNLAKEMGFAGVQFLPGDRYRFNDKSIWPVKINGKYLHNIEPSTLPDNFIKSQSTVKDFGNEFNRNFSFRCPELKRGSVYINTLGEVVPCCMMTHETTNNYHGKEEFFKLVKGNFENISLYKNKIDDIFKNIYNDAFNSTLMLTETMHPVCYKSCKHIATNAKTK